MFEIVNGVVKELTNIKKLIIQQGIGASMMSSMGSVNTFSKANPEQILINGELQPVSPYQIPNHVKTNQYNEDEEESDSDSDYSSSTEDDEVYEDGEDEELESNNTDTIVNEPSDEFDQPESVVINDEPISSISEETSTIKIINYENETPENIDEELPEAVSEQSLEEMNDVDLVHEEDENEIEGLDEEEGPLEEVNEEHVVIKMDEPNESVSETPVPSLKEKEDSYKRLTLNQLKATVIAKGITTDTSRLKKNDLIKLLANFE
jgi:hypothetical protein